ncbi:hypothetical protein [Pseudomonas putida]|uniref:Uncharacterized protein n=1 Tax=Pseudomonas putida TaxID=303 RepID=A0A8I1ECB1_PSEPU|nr:hypothetical protein [Pseudomonas putida]MBI6882737.1 hypothetical protein [Pseudomonas putida]
MENIRALACLHEISNLIVRSEYGVDLSDGSAGNRVITAIVDYSDPLASALLNNIGLNQNPYFSVSNAEFKRSFKEWFAESRHSGSGFGDLISAGLGQPRSMIELDNMFIEFFSVSLSEVHQKAITSLAISSQESGGGNLACYTLGVLLKNDDPKKSDKANEFFQDGYGVSSSVNGIPEVIERVLMRVGGDYQQDRPKFREPISLVLSKLGRPLMKVRVVPGVSEAPGATGMVKRTRDRSRPQLNWRRHEWINQDPELMKALIPMLPDEIRAGFKGRFMTDDLGI